MNIIIKIIRKIISIFMYAVIIFALLITIPKAFQVTPYYVMSGSMEPVIHTGSMVFVKQTKEVKINDIIAYQLDDILITHRYIKDNIDNTIITKGDANNSPDLKSVEKSQIVGKVIFNIPIIGFIYSKIKNQIALFLAIILLSIFDYLLAIIQKSDKKEDKK